MDYSVVRDLFLGSFDRIAILLQAFTEESDFFTWVRPNRVEVAHVERVLCLGVRIVELVAQHRPHLGWVLETKELPLDCCDNGVANEDDSCLSSFVEGIDSTLKVGGIRFATFRYRRVDCRGFSWHLFFSCDDFPCIHHIEHGLRVAPPFDVVRDVQAFEGSQAGDVVVVLFGGVGGGHRH